MEFKPRARGRPVRRAARDVLNWVSLMTLAALCLAVTAVTMSHLNRHYRVVSWDPLVALSGVAAAIPAHAGTDTSAAQEAGIVAPGGGDLTLPLPQPQASLLGTPLPSISPSATNLSRAPLKRGTWLPILMYHYVRIAPPLDRAGYALSVTPDLFQQQMSYLSDHGYTTVTMRDVDLILAGRKSLPTKAVALTFDDGYADFYSTAVPILRSMGMTATNFVPTQLVGRSAYMTWTQIQELDAEGFEMAAHSQFHVDVSKVPATRAHIEIFGSKADLETHLGHPVFDWAYPYGGFNLATGQMVRDAGYWSGATTVAGGWHDLQQMLVLTRIRVGGGERMDLYARNLLPT